MREQIIFYTIIKKIKLKIKVKNKNINVIKMKMNFMYLIKIIKMCNNWNNSYLKKVILLRMKNKEAYKIIMNKKQKII